MAIYKNHKLFYISFSYVDKQKFGADFYALNLHDTPPYVLRMIENYILLMLFNN